MEREQRETKKRLLWNSPTPVWQWGTGAPLWRLAKSTASCSTRNGVAIPPGQPALPPQRVEPPHPLQSKLALGIRVSLLGRLAVPKHGFSAVFCNALTTVVTVPKPELGVRMPLLGSGAVPKHGFLVIFCDAPAG